VPVNYITGSSYPSYISVAAYSLAKRRGTTLRIFLASDQSLAFFDSLDKWSISVPGLIKWGDENTWVLNRCESSLDDKVCQASSHDWLHVPGDRNYCSRLAVKHSSL